MATNLNKRTRINILLVILSMFSLELWQYCRYSDHQVNPWLALDYPLYLGWYLFYLGRYVSLLLMSIFAYRMARIGKYIRIMTIIFAYYSAVSLIAFLINFDKVPVVFEYAITGMLTYLHISYENIDWARKFKRIRIKVKAGYRRLSRSVSEEYFIEA
jgi:hypothetical protein